MVGTETYACQGPFRFTAPVARGREATKKQAARRDAEGGRQLRLARA
jgi:hypothetical protein